MEAIDTTLFLLPTIIAPVVKMESSDTPQAFVTLACCMLYSQGEDIELLKKRATKFALWSQDYRTSTHVLERVQHLEAGAALDLNRRVNRSDGGMIIRNCVDNSGKSDKPRGGFVPDSTILRSLDYHAVPGKFSSFFSYKTTEVVNASDVYTESFKLGRQVKHSSFIEGEVHRWADGFQVFIGGFGSQLEKESDSSIGAESKLSNGSRLVDDSRLVQLYITLLAADVADRAALEKAHRRFETIATYLFRD